MSEIIAQFLLPQPLGKFSVVQHGGLKIGSTSTSGLQLYNTADQVTNYERLEARWNSNVAEIVASAQGTATPRALLIGNSDTISTGAFAKFNSPTREVSFYAYANRFTLGAGETSLTSLGFRFTGIRSNATAGVVNMVSILPAYNQTSGTAANTDLLIGRSGAVGSGAQLFFDCQDGGVSKFRVAASGTASMDSAAGLIWSSRLVLRSPSDGVLRLTNNAESDFARLQFGGATSSFPALKRNGASIQARLADDSGYANFYASDYYTSTGQLWAHGAGSPDGVITAPVGSFYTRTDGGAGTSFYVKESGTGNTGWVAK